MKSLTKILFCGQLRTPFIWQDLEMLRQHYEIDIVNLDFLSVPKIGILKYILYYPFLMIPKIIRNDVVYMWFADWYALPIILAAKLFNKKSIITVGGWEVFKCEEIGYGNQLNLVRGFVTRLCLRNASVILSQSKAYDVITKSVEPNTHTFIVQNAIDTEELCNIVLPVHREGVVTALCTIKFTEKLKGIPTFLEAASKLPYKCEVVEGMSHSKLMDKLRRTKVYCQLSYTEAFGMTTLEAMACGCIPVVTDKDAPPEVIGDTGVVVPYGDVEATIKGIEKAMTMDGNRARERAKIFSRENRMKLLVKVIGEKI